MTDYAKTWDRVTQKFVDVIPVATGSFGNIDSQRILGRVSSGTGAVEVLTPSQAKDVLDIASAIITPLNPNPVIDTDPTIVGSLLLPAATYTAPQAEIGCGDPLHTATLQIKKVDGTVLATITGNGLDWYTGNNGFTLATETEIRLVLFGSAANSVTFIRGFKIG
jgi:hypothetical protein